MDGWLIKVAFFTVLSAYSSDGSNIEWNNMVSSIVDRSSATETEIEGNGENQEESEDAQQDVEEDAKSPESQNESADEPEEAAKDIGEETAQQKANDENEAEVEDKPEESSANSSDEAQQQQETEDESEESAGFDYYPKGQFAVDGAQGETVENDTGIFTIEKQTTDIHPVEVGPIHIQFENISLVSGDVTEEATAGIAGDQVTFIQMDATLQNTVDDPMQFFFASTTLQLNAAQLVAHDMFSGKSNGTFDTQTPRNTTLVYMLDDDNLTAEEINNLTVQITGVPMNMKTEETVGAGTSFDVAF
ncbi:hypothetical protein KFZ58_00230 [Virgibacillus sp. NKC19-16]|uniref:hypothetical protein n=1 Tax=Virgibacillus salidurans TaxID=2831673 RepID=UPI001F2B8F9F|nr:hypothetical protein [Virgibacillus sp. NKC19-16]UJL46450.1 hypothetical protein KFZ58_00230 [Virgibacillus sp. NKC19-16]